jgi:hypothetical protein
MKRLLTFTVACVLCVASFAKPTYPWDLCVSSVKNSVKVFDDPYVTNAGAYVIGTINAPNYACNIQVTFNKTVGVPYYAVVSVMGKWGGSTSASERQFTVLFNSAQHYRSVNFPLHSYEEFYPETAYCSDYGEQ